MRHHAPVYWKAVEAGPPPEPPVTPFTLNITSSLYAPDIRSLAVAAGWNSSDPLIVNITAIYIGALDLGSTAFGSGINLIVSAGTLIGGPPGGDALKTRTPATINNAGWIAGGGGRGNSGDSVTNFRVGNASGRSAAGGSGGEGQGLYASGSAAVMRPAYSGAAGTQSNVVDSITGLSGWAKGGAGGAGGAWGTSGGPGGNTSRGGSANIISIYSPQNNRDPGKAVDGNAYITWVALGNIAGAIA